MFRTEYEFTLPKGLVDDKGNLHKKGIMRLATVADEILPLKDPRVKQNPSYLIYILLSRVIIKLGELEKNHIDLSVIENLYASDFKYLQKFYQKINGESSVKIKVKCPSCGKLFDVDCGQGG